MRIADGQRHAILQGAAHQRQVRIIQRDGAERHAHLPIGLPAAVQRAAEAVDQYLGPACLLEQQPGEAARGVAAGLRLGAVGVVDAHEGGSTG